MEELRRATINATAGAASSDEDFAEVTAEEDRELLGLTITTDQPLRVVTGFSTNEISQVLVSPGANQADVDASRSTIISAYDDAGHVQEVLPEPIEWSAGEGIHVGQVNNDVDNSKLLWMVFYYREV